MLHETGPPDLLISDLQAFRHRLMEEIEDPTPDRIAKRIEKIFISHLGGRGWLDDYASKIQEIVELTLDGGSGMDINKCFDDVISLLSTPTKSVGVRNVHRDAARRSA